MRTKTMIAPAQVKAVIDGDAPGTFEAVVSVYGNVDSAGERIVDGAFDDWLEEFKATGDPLPIVWAHQWGSPAAMIGYANPDDVRSEPGVGLVVKGHLDIEEADARIVHRHMTRRSIRQFSFAFDVLEDGRGDDGVPELRKLAVHEAGPCLLGVNTATDLLGVKAEHAAAAAGGKARVQLSGSVEERLGHIRAAWSAWAVETYGDDLYTSWVEATFEDHIVGYAEAWEDPLDGGTYYQAEMEEGSDGQMSVGDTVAVELVATAVPKTAGPAHTSTRAHRAAAKAGLAGAAGLRPAPPAGPNPTGKTDPPAPTTDDLRARLELITADLTPTA